ncbi:MAG TPA: hypothetical protein VGQ91_09345, partial [Ideonella sp.]|nr:hypothetical protein [Ideonella sp.]
MSFRAPGQRRFFFTCAHLLPKALGSALMLAAMALPIAAHAKVAKARPQPSAAQPDTAPDVVVYGRRDDVVAFAREAAERQGFDAEWAIAQLAQARYQPTVAKLVMPPPAGTAKNW